MDTIIIILTFVTTICWQRHTLGSTDISNSAKKFDLKFQALLNKIANKEAIPTLDETALIYGRLSGLHFGIYFLSLLLKLNDTLWLEYVIFAFSISFGLFISIWWFTRPKQFALTFFFDHTKLFLTLFLLPIIDWLAGTNLTLLLYELFNKFLAAIQLSLPFVSHPFLMALILFIIIEVNLFLFCVISTIFFAPVAFFALVIVVIIIRMARFIDKKFDKNPNQGPCLVPFIVCTAYLVWKSI